MLLTPPRYQCLNVTETPQTQQSPNELMIPTLTPSVPPFVFPISVNSTTIHPGLYARTLGVTENLSLLFPTFNWYSQTRGLHTISSFNDVISFLFFIPTATALVQIFIISNMDHGDSHLAGPPADRCTSFNPFSKHSPNNLFKMHRRANYPTV